VYANPTRLRAISLAVVALVGVSVPAALSAATPSEPSSAEGAVFRPVVLEAAPVAPAHAADSARLPAIAFSVPAGDLRDEAARSSPDRPDNRVPSRTNAPKVHAATAFAPKPTPKPTPKEPSYGSATASGARARVVQVALAQVGDRYVSGGVGPDTFDCSGLVRYAYEVAGVSSKLGGGHSASAMLAWGRSAGLTSPSNGRPGDVAIYGNGSHAAIYLGNGKIVSALNPTQGIRVTGLNALGASFTTFVHTRI
jgi:peptidoglycan DL-endopeptidase CwlO